MSAETFGKSDVLGVLFKSEAELARCAAVESPLDSKPRLELLFDKLAGVGATMTRIDDVISVKKKAGICLWKKPSNNLCR